MTRSEETPYILLLAIFWAGLAAAGLSQRNRLPAKTSLSDLAALGLAAHAIARIVAQDRIAVFVRRPFAEGPAALQPKGTGHRRAIGELLTCPHCLGLWIAAGLAVAQLRFPRGTRLVTGVFAGRAIAEAARKD